MPRPLTIANASAFWGDQPDAAARLVEAQPDLDYLTLDYLAEVSLSIMAIVRAKDPRRATREILSTSSARWSRSTSAAEKTRIVTNAGGLDPEACARAVQAELAEVNWPA